MSSIKLLSAAAAAAICLASASAAYALNPQPLPPKFAKAKIVVVPQLLAR